MKTAKKPARKPAKSLKVGGSIAQFKKVKGSAASIGNPPSAGVQ